jgi:hypothetical protein
MSENGRHLKPKNRRWMPPLVRPTKKPAFDEEGGLDKNFDQGVA